MSQDESLYTLFMPDAEHATREEAEPIFTWITALPVPRLEPIDISHAVLFLPSGEAPYVPGLQTPVNTGHPTK